MLKEEYLYGKQVSDIIKYNIYYSKKSVLDCACIQFINEIIEQKDRYDLSNENYMKLLCLINKLQK